MRVYGYLPGIPPFSRLGVSETTQEFFALTFISKVASEISDSNMKINSKTLLGLHLPLSQNGGHVLYNVELKLRKKILIYIWNDTFIL